ncbi:MAG: PD40 domain-containing protein [Candidatus Cloacimonetes bacterium]|nr:PD40 domain-containing protein [Candidatus Cloacimonadota bacterium]
MKKNIIILIVPLLFIILVFGGCSEYYDVYKDCIYLVDTNGNNLTKVIDLGHTSEFEDSFVPGANDIQFTLNGEKIIYCTPDGNYGKDKLYSVDIDGDDITILSKNLEVWGKPSISRLRIDTNIVFSAYANNVLDIFMTTLDGAEPINLTNSYEVDEKYPNFSPDGNEIIFSKDNDTCSFICKKNLNTGEYDILAVSDDHRFSYPVFSPDGIKIFYIKHSELFVMNSDGSEQVKIFDDIRSTLSFSSDGSIIVFSNYSNLYVMNSEGFIISEIEIIDSRPHNPQLSSDGMYIVYHSDYGLYGVYIIGSDGSNRRKLYQKGRMPVFSPDGNKIAFSSKYFYERVHSSGGWFF